MTNMFMITNEYNVVRKNTVDQNDDDVDDDDDKNHIRQRSPWLWDDWVFALSPTGARWVNIIIIIKITIIYIG